MSLLHTRCVMSEADVKRPERLAQTVWYATLDDVSYINRIFRDVAHIHNMLSLENEADCEAYIKSNFPGCEVELGDDIYRIKRKTSYDTFVTTTIDATSGLCWEVSCNSGNKFHLVMQPSSRGYTATFDTLYSGMQQGTATLDVEYEIVDNVNDNSDALEAVITYDGEIVMVDKEASEKRPVTLTTEITKPIIYREFFGMVDGAMTITCVDELYGTIDVVKAQIFSEPSRVKLIYNNYEDVIYDI